MKAKEYADRFLDPEINNKDHVMGKIIIDFIEESKHIMTKRGSESVPALTAVLKELDLKWKAFARIVEERSGVDAIKPNGFRDFFRGKFPDVYKRCRF